MMEVNHCGNYGRQTAARGSASWFKVLMVNFIDLFEIVASCMYFVAGCRVEHSLIVRSEPSRHWISLCGKK
jgi:hypothetical protein